MTTQTTLSFEKYQYGIDVSKGRQLYGMSGKTLYYGKWISNRKDLIIVEMNETIARHEAYFYRELNGHDHIIRTFGYVENTLNLTIFIQEYAQYGDLANYFLDNQMNISQTILIEIFSQIADAMSYVASKSIIHGDLGCRNILVYKIDLFQPKNILVKLTDFGLARSLNHSLSTNEISTIIPIRYCAPEILQNNNNNKSNYSEKSDVYSMGVFMWEALSNGEMPYSSIASDEEVKQMKLNHVKLIKPSVCDRQLWILMEQCWHFESNERINFEQIKEQLSEITISESEDIRLSISINQPLISYEYKLNEDVRMNESLNGSYGKTFEAQWISKEERPIVLIKIDKHPTEYEHLFYTKFKSNSHIIYTFGYVENNLQSIMLLQERAPYDNLQILLQKNHFQPSTQVLIEIFEQIIDAMIFITDQNIVHGDLRCANILVFEMDSLDPKKNFVKLTNFTSAHENDPSSVKHRRSIIPIRYCAPEILRSAGRSNYSELSDVYSMGVLMWEACSNGQIPYASSILNSEVRQRKLNGEMLIMPLLCDNQIWSIMKDCWFNTPEIRYHFKQMKIRLSQINFESVINRYNYEINVNIKMGNELYGKYGKKFYEAEWIPPKDQQIILLTIDQEIARHEIPFYLPPISHTHIIQTFGFVKNNLRLPMLVQERAPYGNLQILLQNNQFQPSIDILVIIFLQIIDAMIYLVEKNIIHGDLRCKNVLVFKMNSTKLEENFIKLTNFNLARRNDSSSVDKRQVRIPVRYCAPEILEDINKPNYSELSDVYSMGILMWEACSKGSIPYGSDMNENDVQQRKLNNEKLPKPNDCNSHIWDIMHDCWHKISELRYDFKSMKIRLSNIHTTCLHCQNSFRTVDMPNHQKSCLPKDNSIPLPPPPPPKRISLPHIPPIIGLDKQRHLSASSLPENSTERIDAVSNTIKNNPEPSQELINTSAKTNLQHSQSLKNLTTPKPKASTSFFDRVRSIFRTTNK